MMGGAFSLVCFALPWISGAQAGLTRFEVDHLPLGLVFDQIACYQIARCGAKERTAARGSLMSQMTQYFGR